MTSTAATALIVLLLGGDGYWLGGSDVVVEARWIAAEAAQAATLHWRLGTSTAKLADGTIQFAAADEAKQWTIRPPQVRAAVDLYLDWSLTDELGQELVRGRATVHLYPPHLLAALPRLIGQRRVVVVDDPARLPAMLSAAGVEHQQVHSLLEVASFRPELLLIGQGRWPDDPRALPTLRQALAGGARVAIFAQSSSPTLPSVRLSERAAPHELRYRSDAPLFAGMSGRLIGSWISAEPREAWSALRFDTDSTVVPLALWPPVSELDRVRDAAAAVVLIEDRPVLLWQIPLPGWHDDPRSQMCLLNIVDTLLSAGPPPDLPFKDQNWKSTAIAPQQPGELP